MKFLQPKPGQSIDLFRMLAQREGYKLSDPETTDKFINNIAEEFMKAKSNPIMLHGFRIQSMFEYVAASLGKSSIVKTEDAGGVHTKDTDIKIPDLRILLIDGQEFFVEVKNFYQSTPFEKYEKCKKSYLDNLRRYASLFKKEIRLAIYWSKWNHWTLMSLDKIKFDGKKCSISFEDAFKENEMTILGDCILATLPPLTFRVVTDPAHDQSINESGEAKFRIGGIELYAAETLIVNPQEQNIALFLMLYGNWSSLEKPKANVENGKLISFDFINIPPESTPEQPFQTIGSMSSMISSRFNSLTAHEGTIELLSPKTDVSNLGITIPENYQGESLHLWRFILGQSSQ